MMLGAPPASFLGSCSPARRRDRSAGWPSPIMHILLAAATMFALISVPAAFADSNVTETVLMVCTDPKTLSADAVYIGGATIIALAAFGSALGTGVMIGKNERIEWRDTVMMFSIVSILGGAIFATFTQGLSMLHVCCSDSPMLREFTAATIAAAVIIIFGFALITAKRLWFGYKAQGRQSGAQDDTNKTGAKTKQDEGQSGAQGGASTELHLRFKSGQGTSDMSFTNSGGKS